MFIVKQNGYKVGGPYHGEPLWQIGTMVGKDFVTEKLSRTFFSKRDAERECELANIRDGHIPAPEVAPAAAAKPKTPPKAKAKAKAKSKAK